MFQIRIKKLQASFANIEITKLKEIIILRSTVILNESVYFISGHAIY